MHDLDRLHCELHDLERKAIDLRLAITEMKLSIAEMREPSAPVVSGPKIIENRMLYPIPNELAMRLEARAERSGRNVLEYAVAVLSRHCEGDLECSKPR